MYFKNRYVDFVVEEQLPTTLTKKSSPQTPWCYIKVEKINRNTMDMVHHIMKDFGLPRKKIGIAGLKDKHALTRQYFCFHNNDIAKIGEQKFFKQLNSIVKVVDYGFSGAALNLSTPIMNEFWIRLRKNPKHQELKALHQSLQDPRSTKKGKEITNSQGIKGESLSKALLEEKIKELFQKGFLNLYGEQRFGFTHANHRIAQDIIAGKYKHLPQQEKVFKLQALASWLFNHYCNYRYTIYTQETITGDILDKEGNITGPVIGEDMRRAEKNSEAGELENEWRSHFEINDQLIAEFKKLKIFGRRRAFRVVPQQSSYSWQGEDLLLHFLLPSGSYASVLVGQLLGEESQ